LLENSEIGAKRKTYHYLVEELHPIFLARKRTYKDPIAARKDLSFLG
jgi:hypothetical protein